MRRVGKIPSYSNDQLEVWAHDRGRVELRIVGERGGVKGTIELSDWGFGRLVNLGDMAIADPEGNHPRRVTE